MKKNIFPVLSLGLLLCNLLHAQDIKTYGIKINVSDLNKGIEFYGYKLGFEVESKIDGYLFLKTNDNTKLVLHEVANLLPEGKTETRAGLTLQVNDIDKTIASLKAKGVDFGMETKRKEGVGYAISVEDPFGKQVSLLQETVTKLEPFSEPQIYNYGFMVSDMNKAIEFYATSLGFEERSKKYLPYDMPLGHKDGSFAFMLHFREGIEPMKHNSTDSEHVVILLKTSDLASAIAILRKKGVQCLQKKPLVTPLGKAISFYDPFGYLSELIEVK